MIAHPDPVLLTPEQMYAADAAAIATGVPGIDLMENAGRAIFREIILRWSQRPVIVLCGPGNNGGDGFVVARLLAEEGWPVRLALMGERGRLGGDAALAATAWPHPVEKAGPETLQDARLIVDALFGAGLARPIEGVAKQLVESINRSGWPVVAVDIPSGVCGESGQVRGDAVRADLTVTFHRCKPGHVLFPGRQLCGQAVCADIGIPPSVISKVSPHICANIPALWEQFFSTLSPVSHKYHHGHAVVVSGGPANTGAARLAALAALRSGAGLVTVASPEAALAANAAHLTSIMLTAADTAEQLTNVLKDKRKNAITIGPGAGVGSKTRAKVRAVLAAGPQVVLDADALTSFENDPQSLFEAIAEFPGRPVVMTPHDGEFTRLFKGLIDQADSKWQRTQIAAKLSGAVVILKGPDTVIASPDGRIAINNNAPPSLATAGSGDVLTGIVTGLLARQLPPYEAAAAAVWLHGKAGALAGTGLIADGLPHHIPAALATI